ncbi:MAG TPA: dienelactone hydrolase family protein [Streptosporangiaceae bacterium]|nr:dienelactone hydrolase family protein [Streptosporangiaceae bacterium]
MSDVVLFHHAQGRTDGIVQFAERLRSAGHQVTVPDLFEGKTFTSIEDGVGYAQSTGFDTIIERGRAAAEALPAEVVYAGFSLGVLPAQMLAQTRAGARGALLLEACVPVSEFSSEWPSDVPVQIHGMDSDAFFAGEGDLDAAKDLVATAKDAELFLYPGDRHLFADSSLRSYDEGAASLLTQRVLDFLGRVG